MDRLPWELFSLINSIKYTKVGDCVQWENRNDIVRYCPLVPFYKHIGLKDCGDEKFNFFKLFNPMKYHLQYGDRKIYEA